jgi:hypothetical protein
MQKKWVMVFDGIVQIQEKNSMIFINAASHYYINDLKKNHLRKNNSDYKNLKLQTDY